ncbi:hypothetical protein [Aliagarivorans taiwanensis]|uniref:hypothetical protein n=1 Tax=Aliagarivorans taiwanensis TaxID=561966 RepID=UPI00047CB363|nr:hypothetical protein [Aliagarivorans taiwanensis]
MPERTFSDDVINAAEVRGMSTDEVINELTGLLTTALQAAKADGVQTEFENGVVTTVAISQAD